MAARRWAVLNIIYVMADSPYLALLKAFLAYGKDIIGLLGTILTIIPFFREWRLKAQITRAEEGPGLEGYLTHEAFSAIAEKYRKEYFLADKSDLLLISVGLGLISLSFVFSFILTCLD
jgi:hypothetical protein